MNSDSHITSVRYNQNRGLFMRVVDKNFSERSLENLRRLVGSKETLIKKALDANNLNIVFDGKYIMFPWFERDLFDYEIAPIELFLTRLVETAFSLKRATIREKEVDNEKFTFRLFLLRLGFVGSEYKLSRRFLMRNLSGNSAYRTPYDAEKAKRKHK